MKHNTIKLSDLINALEELKEDEGDLPVAISQDEEGNVYSTLSANNFIENCVDIEDGILIIYPAVDHLDLEDISSEEEIISDKLITPRKSSRCIYDDEDDEEDEEVDDDEPPYGCAFGSDDE